MRRITPKPAMSLGSARLPPPHFAGRKPELDLLNQGLDYLLQTGDPSGGIVLIIGVPGIGKTQLARRFTDDAKERHKGVVSCVVETSVLESPVSLFMDIARLFSRSRTKEHVRHTPSFGTLSEHGHLHRGAALASALAAGHRHREAYYDMIADKMGPDRSVIHPVVALMRARKAASLTHEEATRAVSDNGRDGTAVIWRAIEHGVLKLNRGEVSFGITSFHAYMQQSLSRAEARAREKQPRTTRRRKS